MARKRLTREEKKAQTRAEVLGAAARLFAERGFHATSVEAITEEAGFSRGAFYSNFERKEDLLLALLEDHEAPVSQVFDRLDERIGKVMPKFRREHHAATETHEAVVGAGRGWSLLFLELWVCAARDEEIGARLHETLAMVRRTLAAELAESYEESGTQPRYPVEDMASALLVIACGWLFADLADPEGAPARAVVADVMDDIRRGTLEGAEDARPARSRPKGRRARAAT